MARIRKNPVFKGSRVRVTGSFVLDQQRFTFNCCSGREVCERLRAYIGNQQHAEKLPVSALLDDFRRATILLPVDCHEGQEALISVCINGHTYDYTQLIPVLHQLCKIYDFPWLAEILYGCACPDCRPNVPAGQPRSRDGGADEPIRVSGGSDAQGGYKRVP